MHLINSAVMVLVEKTATQGRTGQGSRGGQGKPLAVVISPGSSASKRPKAPESQQSLPTSYSYLQQWLQLWTPALRLQLPAVVSAKLRAVNKQNKVPLLSSHYM